MPTLYDYELNILFFFLHFYTRCSYVLKGLSLKSSTIFQPISLHWSTNFFLKNALYLVFDWIPLILGRWFRIRSPFSAIWSEFCSVASVFRADKQSQTQSGNMWRWNISLQWHNSSNLDPNHKSRIKIQHLSRST